MANKLILMSLVPYLLLGQVSAETLEEKDLVSLAKKSNPTTQALEARLLAVESQQRFFDDQFTSQWYANANYQNSNLMSVVPNNPIWGPTQHYETGIRTKLNYGISGAVFAYGNKRSSTGGMINDSARIGVRFRLEMDLWKNLLGQLDNSKRLSIEKRALMQKSNNEILLKQLEVEVRKIYWSLIANHRSIQVTQKLLVLAKQQQKEAGVRANLAIAEKDEIARYKAQVASVQAKIHSLEFRKKGLERALFQMVPEAAGKTLKLDRQDDEKVTQEVFQCTMWIANQSKTPWEHTEYGEVIKLDEERYQSDLNELNKYDSLDLKVFYENELTNNGIGFDESVDKFGEGQANDYMVGISVAVPLGSTLKDSKDFQVKAKAAELASSISNIRSEVEARHASMRGMIDLLTKLLETQKENSSQLDLVQKGSTRRYRQARIPVEVLIQDQNAAQASEIDQTNAQLAIIHEVLDYFRVFNKAPCSINKL